MNNTVRYPSPFAMILLSMLMIIIACTANTQNSTKHTWYISPNGNDQNNGAQDSPLLTLKKAVEMSRTVKGQKTIIINEGEYYDVNIKLTKKDNGLTIQAAPDTRPTLYGGILISKWNKNGKFLTSSIPGSRDRNWDFRVTEVDKKWRQRARSPEVGAFTHLNKFDVRWLSSEAGGWERKPTDEELTTLKYRSEDIPKNIDVTNAELTIYHEWDETLVGLKGHNQKDQRLEFLNESGHPPGAFAKRNPNAQTYVVWNTKEGMNKPGQWYLDRTNEKINYWPKEDEDITSLQMVIPKHQNIIKLEKGTSDITIEGIRLSSTTTRLITGGYGAIRFDGAISGEDVKNINLLSNEIANVGGWGIKLKGTDIKVQQSEIYNCGAGTIQYRGERVEISKNKLHDIGLVYKSAVGILGNGDNNLISHNEIYNMPYCGINGIGHNSLVDANVIHNIKTFMQDGGAIYMFGHKNTKVTNNVVLSDPASGIKVYAYYLDEGCKNCSVSKNLAYNTTVPVQAHMTKNCSYENNVFLDKGHQSIRYANTSDMTFSKNILIADEIEFKGASHNSPNHAKKEANEVMDSYASANGITDWTNNIIYAASNKPRLIEMSQYDVFQKGDLPALDDSKFELPFINGINSGVLSGGPNSLSRRMNIELRDFSTSGYNTDLASLINRYYIKPE